MSLFDAGQGLMGFLGRIASSPSPGPMPPGRGQDIGHLLGRRAEDPRYAMEVLGRELLRAFVEDAPGQPVGRRLPVELDAQVNVGVEGADEEFAYPGELRVVHRDMELQRKVVAEIGLRENIHHRWSRWAAQ